MTKRKIEEIADTLREERARAARDRKEWESDKARAWEVVALYAEQGVRNDPSVPESVRKHVLTVLVPSLYARAEIVERNRSRSTPMQAKAKKLLDDP